MHSHTDKRRGDAPFPRVPDGTRTREVEVEITNEESEVQELSTLYTSPRRDVTSDCNYADSSCGKER